MEDKKQERGFITLVLLVVFLGVAIFLYALYQYAIVDYQQVTASSLKKGQELQQINLLEPVKKYYVEDMRNDKSYSKVEEDLKNNNDWKIDFQNYMYETSVDKKDDSWEIFRNYQETLPDSSLPKSDPNYVYKRSYLIGDNWDVKDKSGVYDSKTSSLLLPKTIYIRVKFDPSVSRADFIFKNSFEHARIELLNRGSSYNEYKIEGLPVDVQSIEIVSNNSLGSTQLSLLKSREVVYSVYEKNDLGMKKGSPVVIKRLEIGLAKEKNKIIEKTE